MSDLPGNPHAHEAEHGMSCTVLSAESTGTQNLESLLMDNAQATLALAFELRTANLIAYMQLGVLAQEQGVTFEDDIADEIMGRLGITTKEPDNA